VHEGDEVGGSVHYRKELRLMENKKSWCSGLLRGTAEICTRY
jgi:hypothetical protein